MNVNTRMLSSVIMISLLALMGTLYVSVPIANADDLVEEVPIANADDIVEEPPRAVTQPVFEVVFLDQYGDEYGYVIGEDGTIIEEFDNDGSDWIISETSPPTQRVSEVVFLDQYGDEYGYVIGEDGTIIEEFDGDY